MNACTSDRCNQGRRECPCPQACQVADEDGPLHPLTTRELVGMVFTIVALVGAAVGLVFAAAFNPDLLATLRF